MSDPGLVLIVDALPAKGNHEPRVIESTNP